MQQLEKFTDDALVNAYATGNNDAFDVLLARHQARIHNYILQMVKDADIAEDIFQETFVKVVTTIRQGRYTESGRFAAWLSCIARNLVIDHFRQGAAAMTVSTDDDKYDVLNRRDLSDDNIEDAMIDSQIRTDVRHLIKELPEPQRQVVVMRYYKNLSFKEIADATGVSINTALGRMRYAIFNLRRMAKERNIVLTR